MTSSLAMALDEIIQQGKKPKGSSPRATSDRRRVLKMGDSGAEAARTSARTRFPQRGFVSGDVPAGRWKHDKFFEMHGGGTAAKRGGGGGIRRVAVSPKASLLAGGKSTGGGGGIGARLARKAVSVEQSGIVKLQVSNLPDSVVTSDLEELFQDYNVYGVAVHYDETGAHLGTADLFTDTQSAAIILREFKDIAIDNQEIKFCIVSEGGETVSPKKSIRDRLRRVSNKPIGKAQILMKRRGRPVKGVRAAKAGAAARKARVISATSSPAAGASKTVAGGKAKTAEDLDRELEDYMAKK